MKILTHQQAKTAAKKIRAAYRLNRPCTLAEVSEEIANIERKIAKGNLDDFHESLLASLTTGPHPIEFERNGG